MTLAREGIRIGAGKSTLLRMLAGLTAGQGGSVTVSPPGASIGYLPQEPDGTGQPVPLRSHHALSRWNGLNSPASCQTPTTADRLALLAGLRGLGEPGRRLSRAHGGGWLDRTWPRQRRGNSGMSSTLNRSLVALAFLGVLAAGCSTASSAHSPARHPRATAAASSQPSAPSAPASSHPAAQSSNPIPQNNGGDQDADNNGGPSDVDGNI
jgi:energy-coupling factor transporter ATP-binding protein EcfA2